MVCVGNKVWLKLGTFIIAGAGVYFLCAVTSTFVDSGAFIFTFHIYPPLAVEEEVIK